MNRDFFRILKTVLSYRSWVLLSILLGFLTVGSGIGLLMTSAYIISKAALHPSIADLQVGIVGVRFFGIARGVFRYLERLVSHDLTFKLLSGFRLRFYKSILHLSSARLMQYRSADLLTRIVNDIESLQHIFIRVIYPPVVAVLITVLMWFLLGIFDLRFAIAMVLLLILSGLVVPLITFIISRKPNEKLIHTRKELNILILDGIQGMPELLASNQQSSFLSRLEQLNTSYQKIQQRLTVLSGFNEALIGFMMHIAVIILFYLAIPVVNEGIMNGLYLAVITLGVISSFEAVIPMPEAFQHLRESTAAGERLYQFLVDKKRTEPETKRKQIPEEYDLRIKDLRFAYESSALPVLDGINIDLPFGKKIAVVGESGSGKSSIANVLLRFWKNWEGTITIGGRDIRQFDDEQFRKLFSVVSQHRHLFNETVRYNLQIADSDATDERLWLALENAGLKTFVENLPERLDTVVGPAGSRLSGGEAQRLALARAFLKPAPVWILDEATSRLDIENEQAILDKIWNLPGRPSVLMFTHRLSSLGKTDEIIVLDNGKIIEHGTYRFLMEAQGYFYRTWLEQNERRLVERLRTG